MQTVATFLPLLSGTHDFQDSPKTIMRQWQRLAPKADLHPCEGLGPDGEALHSTSLWLGDHDAPHVLVLLSGVHGVETAVGSAIQTDLLQAAITSAWQPPPATAVLLIHGLCPWGFAWSRRCDADGVDLNRNGLDFTAPPPPNAGYEALRPLLGQGDHQRHALSLAEARLQFGDRPFEEAFSAGQYTDATGPFYGGCRPAHGHRLSNELITGHDLPGRRVCVLDIHSGLGPYGYGELICDLPDDGLATALAYYGDAVTKPAAGTSSSVPKHGLMDLLWYHRMGAGSTYLTLEFGTFGTDALFEVLLDDHTLWAGGRPEEDLRQRQVAAMRHHFVPRDPFWRSRVLMQGRLLIHQFLGDSPWN